MAMTTDSAAQCEPNDHPADRAFSDSNRDTRLGFATGRYIPGPARALRSADGPQLAR